MGTLVLSPEVDPNFEEPESQITVAMAAAAAGQVELLSALIEAMANIHAETPEGSTPLAFAAECTCSTKCMSLLLEARADVHHRSGTRGFPRWSEFIAFTGHDNPLIHGVMINRNSDGYELLQKFGYDGNS